jgi:hypothetical protein
LSFLLNFCAVKIIVQMATIRLKHISLMAIGLSLLFITVTSGCKKEPKDIPDPVIPLGPKLIVKLSVDSTQQRLGNTGQPSNVGVGNAAQSPLFNAISAHYFELAPSAFTLLGEGEVLYHAEETSAGGSPAIDFSKSVIVEPGETFLEIPISKELPCLIPDSSTYSAGISMILLVTATSYESASVTALLA